MSKEKQKHALIFGGSGFLGSYLADELRQRKIHVTVADLEDGKSSKSRNEKNAHFVRCDISDPAQVAKAFSCKPQLVFNLAGLANIDVAAVKPVETFSLNVMGNLYILENARKHKIERFVYASSAYAASNKGSFYGISKLTSEKIIEEFAEQFGMPFTIIRYGSLYGERADENNGIYRLLRQAIEHKKIVHKGDGEEMREYIHASDAARLTVQAALNPQQKDTCLLFSGVEKLKLRDVLHMIKEILNEKVKIEFSNKLIRGHYRVTPYSFQPNTAQKMVANPYIDFGQGLINCIKQISIDLKLEENRGRRS